LWLTKVTCSHSPLTIFVVSDDVIPVDDWGNVIDLPTDVLLKTTSYDGSWASRINKLASDWISATPVGDEAPFMSGPSLIAHEEFDAVVFNAVHGYFRQALGCLRNVLEVLAAAAGLAVTNDTTKYEAWQAGTEEVPMREARRLLENSQAGSAIDAAVTSKSSETTTLTGSNVGIRRCAPTRTAARVPETWTSGRATGLSMSGTRSPWLRPN
jgi:hypothetical protein